MSENNIVENAPLEAGRRKLITPEVGKVYLVRHDGRVVKARCLSVEATGTRHSVYGVTKATTHYRFLKLATGREIVLKSRVKIISEVTV